MARHLLRVLGARGPGAGSGEPSQGGRRRLAPGEPAQPCALALSLPPLTPVQLEARLRIATPPVIARIEQDTLLLDMLTLLPEDLPALKKSLQGALTEGKSQK